jgi:hypothetical protein
MINMQTATKTATEAIKLRMSITTTRTTTTSTTTITCSGSIVRRLHVGLVGAAVEREAEAASVSAAQEHVVAALGESHVMVACLLVLVLEVNLIKLVQKFKNDIERARGRWNVTRRHASHATTCRLPSSSTVSSLTPALTAAWLKLTAATE